MEGGVQVSAGVGALGVRSSRSFALAVAGTRPPSLPHQHASFYSCGHSARPGRSAILVGVAWRGEPFSRIYDHRAARRTPTRGAISRSLSLYGVAVTRITSISVLFCPPPHSHPSPPPPPPPHPPNVPAKTTDRPTWRLIA